MCKAYSCLAFSPTVEICVSVFKFVVVHWILPFWIITSSGDVEAQDATNSPRNSMHPCMYNNHDLGSPPEKHGSALDIRSGYIFVASFHRLLT